MKCPVCTEEFGYLLLKYLKKLNINRYFITKTPSKYQQFTTTKIQKKADFFIYGTLIFLVVLLGVEYIIPGESISKLSTILIITICPVFLLLGYIQIKKMDKAEYQKVVEDNDICELSGVNR